jgi:hypothetical protein
MTKTEAIFFVFRNLKRLLHPAIATFAMTGFGLEKTTSSSRGEVEVFEQMTKTEAI